LTNVKNNGIIELRVRETLVKNKEVNGLGAVAIDVHKKEREYQHLTLSDEEVVKYLLQYRSKVDVAYGANTNINMNQAGDMFEFNQELIALYASLDVAMSKVEFKDKEARLLELIFEGNTMTDVIERHDYARKTAYRTLNRIVDKIVAQNNSDWKEVMEGQGYISK
jgi:DNA-binding CsgD family transcriptional regulator